MKILEPLRTTFGVSDTGNTQALLMCLASVINARRVPHKIQIRFEGEFPSFSNFYLEQLSEFARIAGIEFSFHVARSTGVRDARDWHVNNCSTEFLWMGDNDVIYAPDCLLNLAMAKEIEDPLVAYVQGVKSDLNNRRNYPNFYSAAHPRSEIKEGCSFNHRYDQLPDTLNPNTRFPTVRVRTLDTGNVLLNVNKIVANKIRFRLFEDSLNSGGEDTLFALQIYKAGLEGRFCPSAVSYHLEKPNPTFGEFAARGEMILRACDLLDLDKEAVKAEFMCWLFK